MEFNDTVRRFCTGLTHQEIADAIGVSIHSVRQALLPSDTAGYRNPPQGWEAGLAQLARTRSGELVKLVEQLETKWNSADPGADRRRLKIDPNSPNLLDGPGSIPEYPPEPS